MIMTVTGTQKWKEQETPCCADEKVNNTSSVSVTTRKRESSCVLLCFHYLYLFLSRLGHVQTTSHTTAVVAVAVVVM